MNWHPTRRQLLAVGGAAVGSAGLFGSAARAQAGPDTLTVGAVFPSRSGLGRVLTSVNDFTGEAARDGSLLAEQRIGIIGDQSGVRLTVLQASSPTPAAAIRAAERLVEFNHVDALVGGVGDGQLEVLLPIAERAGIPLFNVGTPDLAFRREGCSRNLFHIEASDAMYLDAMIMWSAARGNRRWFVVYENDARGQARQMAAVNAIAKHGAGGEAVGGASVIPEQPIYFNEIEQARRAGADAILVIINSIDQIAFFGQLDAAQIDVELVPFPDPTSQTRDFILALRQITRGYTPTHRFQLWDPTLADNGAADFQDIYLSRFAAPADPTGWASYQAVNVLLEAVLQTGSKELDAVASYLERPDVEFDVLKGPGVSFRPWDHQLRQPLYAIEIDVDYQVQAALIGAQLESQLAVARVETMIPGDGPTDDPVAWLDQLGDGPDPACRL
jgi:ABC-type branched-subunit amino acid transport system substrate-binding protein